jgi:cytidine deaminase
MGLRQVILMSETIRTERLAALYADAQAAAENSYSPYSKFRVGAALLLTNGQVVTGTNVENVSYGLTICAERSAIVRAVAEQGPEVRIAAIAIANLNGAACPPCGACRQVIAEFTDADTPVLFPATEGVKTVPFSQILPFVFDADLKK